MSYLAVHYLKDIRCFQNKTKEKIKEEVWAKIVCNYKNISIEDFYSKSQKLHIVDARYLYFALINSNKNLILTRIGAPLKKDHSTVLHGLKKVKDVKDLQEDFQYLEINYNQYI